MLLLQLLLPRLIGLLMSHLLMLLLLLLLKLLSLLHLLGAKLLLLLLVPLVRLGIPGIRSSRAFNWRKVVRYRRCVIGFSVGR